jgi:hypothetical protein
MAIHCCVMHGDLLLHCTQQSAAALHIAICCCIVHSNLLLHCTQQSAAALHTAICCCIAYSNLLLRHAWQSTAGCNVACAPYQLPPRAPPASNLQVGAEDATTAKSKALVLEAKSSAQSGLKMPPPLSMGHGAHSCKGVTAGSR